MLQYSITLLRRSHFYSGTEALLYTHYTNHLFSHYSSFRSYIWHIWNSLSDLDCVFAKIIDIKNVFFLFSCVPFEKLVKEAWKKTPIKLPEAPDEWIRSIKSQSKNASFDCTNYCITVVTVISPTRASWYIGHSFLHAKLIEFSCKGTKPRQNARRQLYTTYVTLNSISILTVYNFVDGLSVIWPGCRPRENPCIHISLSSSNMQDEQHSMSLKTYLFLFTWKSATLYLVPPPPPYNEADWNIRQFCSLFWLPTFLLRWAFNYVTRDYPNLVIIYL